jgi:hypothetical protein
MWANFSLGVPLYFLNLRLHSRHVRLKNSLGIEKGGDCFFQVVAVRFPH